MGKNPEKKPIGEYSVDDVQDWIENLPIANIGKAAELVFEFLGQLAKSVTDIETSFTKLSLFASTINYLHHGLRRYYLGKTALSIEKKYDIINLSIALENRYATDFAVLLKQIIDHKKVTEFTDLTAKTIHHGLFHLKNVFVTYCQIYTSVPKNYWVKVHKLYHYAEDYNLCHLHLTEENVENSLSNIDNIYKHILLLATSDPYSLRYNEISKLDQALLSWSSLSKVFSGTKEELEQAIFSIDLDQDMYARYTKLNIVDLDSKSVRGFDTKQLINHLDDILKQHTDAVLTKKIISAFSQSLLRYLARVWGVPYMRKEERLDEDEEVRACITLSSVHYYLSEQKTFIPKRKSDEVYTGELTLEQNDPGIETEEPSSTAQTTGDPWDVLFASSKNIATDSETMFKSLAHKHKVHNWKILNISPAGYCLKTEDNEDIEAQPGELIAFQHVSQTYSYQWTVGTVQWLKKNQEDMIKAGIAHISHRAMAIAARVQRKTPTEYVNALYVPENIDKDKPPMLILPPLHYNVGEVVHIMNNILDSNVQLKIVIQTNSSFCIFKIDIIKIFKDEIKISKKIGDDDSDLDSVWDELE